MLKNKNKKFLLLKILVGVSLLTPTFSNSSYAEEKIFSFDVNVAKAYGDVNSDVVKKEKPLVTEEAKKAKEQNNKNQSESLQETNENTTQSSPVISSVITPTLPSTATGKIVSDAKDENDKPVNRKQREFIEFTTKNGKKLYLIIDRNDQGKEVKLVTEVSPQDLASMIDTSKNQNQQPVKETPKAPPKTVKKESNGVSVFVYIFGIALLLALGFVLFAGFKKRQKKGQEELEELEEYEEKEEYEDNESYKK